MYRLLSHHVPSQLLCSTAPNHQKQVNCSIWRYFTVQNRHNHLDNVISRYLTVCTVTFALYTAKHELFNGTGRSETVEMASTNCTWQYRASNRHSCSILTFRPIKTNLIQRIEVSTLDKCVLDRLMAPTGQTTSEVGKCASRFKWNVVNCIDTAV